jgi:hypothetical protein
MYTLLEEIKKIAENPEDFRAKVRSEQGNLSSNDAKLITMLRFVIAANDGALGNQLFFMTGLFKAGTTWMGLLLNAHPGLCCPEREIHSFSAQVSELYLGRALEELPPSEAKVWGENILEAKRAALFWQILSASNKPSAKRLGGRGPVANINALIRAFPEIKIPVIVRDGRDIAVSAAFFHQKYYGQSWERFFENAEMNRINSEYAMGWGWQFKDFYSKAFAMAREYPNNVMIVRYEDLLVDPMQYMAKVYGFLSVSAEQALVKACVDSCSFERLSGGRSRGSADSSSFFRKGISGDWKNYFTKKAVEEFKKVAGDFLIESGYESNDNWNL